jgi:hypothetical protein
MSPDSVVFERWGGKETLQSPHATFVAIRDICHNKLPANPPRRPETMMRIKYDPTFGWIEMTISPKDAERLAQHLSGGDQLPEDEVKALVYEMLEAVDAHKQFLNKEGEPGL